jgi:hypothetical protein
MSRRNFNDGQEIIFEDLNAITSALERTLFDNYFSKLLKGQTNKIWGRGFELTFQNSSTVQVSAGFGIQQDATQASPEPVQRPIILAAPTNAVVSTPDAVDDRIDLICVKAALANELSAVRKFKDAGTEVISNVTMVIQKLWEAEILVVAGTPDPSPSAPATPAGYLKIGEVYVTNTTGIANQAAITDTRPRFAFEGYDAIVGTEDHCTHTTLAAAIADMSTGAKVLVEASEALDATVDLDVNNLQLDFKPNVTLSKGTANIGLSVNADGVRINGGRFSGFSTGGDKAIEIVSGADFAILIGQRFLNCDTEIDDLSGSATILANVSE